MGAHIHEPSNAELLAAIHGLASTLVDMQTRIARLESPPTKAELTEMVRHRDARIALLEQELANARTAP